MVGWLKIWMVDDKKNRWMVGWMDKKKWKKIWMDNGYEKIDGWLDG